MIYSMLEHVQAMYVYRGVSVRRLMVYLSLKHAQVLYVWKCFSMRLLMVYSRLEHAQALNVYQVTDGLLEAETCSGHVCMERLIS